MAYAQTPGQTRGENPAISTLTNGGGEDKKKKKKVKSFNNETKETSVSYNKSWNSALLFLKPTVFTFARLFEITSRFRV